MKKTTKERFFSIELKSKVNLKNVTLTNGNCENVLVEGTLGRLNRAEFIEDIILEVVGESGVLRINLCQDEIKKKQPANGGVNIE
jgi:hypothetical protein